MELILFSWLDVKLTSKFLGGTKGFDAILPEAAECRMAGFFAEPELTSNTTMLVVHGGADDYTLAKFCKEHAERIKAPPGKVKLMLKKVGTMYGTQVKNHGEKKWR